MDEATRLPVTVSCDDKPTIIMAPYETHVLLRRDDYKRLTGNVPRGAYSIHDAPKDVADLVDAAIAQLEAELVAEN